MKVVITAVLINIMVPVAQWFALSPNGSNSYIQVASLLLVPVIVSFLAVPFLVLLLLKREFRRAALQFIVASLIYGIIGWSFFYLGSLYRMSRFEAVARQSEYLIVAIQRYKNKNGYPPPRLEELIPSYIPSVPKTGMGAYPDYYYRSTKNDPGFASPWFNGTWMLYIDIPLNDKRSEKFIYFPERDIPQQREGNIIKRIDDWIYVRD